MFGKTQQSTTAQLQAHELSVFTETSSLRWIAYLRGKMQFKFNCLSPRKQAVWVELAVSTETSSISWTGCLHGNKQFIQDVSLDLSCATQSTTAGHPVSTEERRKKGRNGMGLKEEGRCDSTATFRFTIMIRALTNIQGAPAQGRPTLSCFAGTENSVGPFDPRVGPLSCNVLTDTALLWARHTLPPLVATNRQQNRWG